MTPEGKVKAKVKKFLADRRVYWFMPVQAGYGSPGLDFHCVLRGYAFFIETKAPGKSLTPRQRLTAAKVQEAGAPVFVVTCDDDLTEVESWMARVLLITD